MIHFKAYFYADYIIQITLHVEFNEAKWNFFYYYTFLIMLIILKWFDISEGLTTKLNYRNSIIKVKWYFAIGLNPIQSK